MERKRFKPPSGNCLRSYRGNCIIESQGNQLSGEIRVMQMKHVESPRKEKPIEDDFPLLSIKDAILLVQKDENYRNKVTSGLLASMRGSVCQSCSLLKTLKGG